VDRIDYSHKMVPRELKSLHIAMDYSIFHFFLVAIYTDLKDTVLITRLSMPFIHQINAVAMPYFCRIQSYGKNTA
ncbi:MAG: hypothetical protein Q8908_15070, partial [Bacteroidota bacterium]|nr:hypothetical protein [Bacteroidota bacterium]